MRDHDRRRTVALPLVLCLGLLAAPGCEDDFLGPEAAESPILNRTLQQQDRFGFPAINTAFVSSDADKNAFNRAAPADDEQFVPVAAEVIMNRFAVNQDDATALADLVLPDVQPLGDLGGALFNGRRLPDDVIDIELGVLFGEGGLSDAAPAPGLASDNVDGNDKPFLDTFPYLAGPHTP